MATKRNWRPQDVLLEEETVSRQTRRAVAKPGPVPTWPPNPGTPRELVYPVVPFAAGLFADSSVAERAPDVSCVDPSPWAMPWPVMGAGAWCHPYVVPAPPYGTWGNQQYSRDHTASAGSDGGYWRTFPTPALGWAAEFSVPHGLWAQPAMETRAHWAPEGPVHAPSPVVSTSATHALDHAFFLAPPSLDGTPVVAPQVVRDANVTADAAGGATPPLVTPGKVAGEKDHVVDNRFVCETCGAAFVRRQNLVDHMRYHTGERPFACEVCGSAFAHRQALTTHMRTHTGKQAFPCRHCSSTFTHRSSLAIHMRRHTGERPFACEDCGASFADRSTLTVHERTHTGVRPYPCRFCDATFFQTGHRRNHERIHTGDKPYRCKHCVCTFHRAEARAQHEKRFHRPPPPRRGS